MHVGCVRVWSRMLFGEFCADRHLGCEGSGLVDLEFLGLADAFVGSAGSTYSFVAHARALLPPRYASFVAEVG